MRTVSKAVVVALVGLAAYAVVRGGEGVRRDVARVGGLVGVGGSVAAPATTDAAEWRTETVVRGPLQAAVLATGTLQPTKTVQVSSQISGQIAEVLVDFNDRVEKGQLVARLDPTNLQGKLATARADLAVAEASVKTKEAALGRVKADLARLEITVADARRGLDRARRLANTGSGTERAEELAETLVRQTEAQIAGSKADLATAEADIAVARATVEQRRAAVTVAETDLDRTFIRAPIAGLVVDRQVEVGQTVAASLSAPILFMIAARLEEMQVEASIDEADIGRVKAGQRVTFTVDAYPERSFEGVVDQVRRAAKAAQNVVTYTATVTAENRDLALFPGMTANVRVLLADKQDVLKVPAAALRFRPSEGDGPKKRAVVLRPSAETGTRATLHLAQADGSLRKVEVTIGVATEAEVEIVTDEVKPGDKVVTGRAETGARRTRSPIGF